MISSAIRMRSDFQQQGLRRAVSLLLVVLAFSVSASARQLKIAKFSAEIVVNRDSSIDVTETMLVGFNGQWNGLTRTIPVEYLTPEGLNKSFDIKLVGATDSAGETLKVDSQRQGAYLKWKIWVPNASDRQETIHIHYLVRNALGFFDDHDELYWNVTGNQADVPLGNASARITLPEGATGVDASDDTGVMGSRGQDATSKIQDNVVQFATTRPLRFHEGLTIDVRWDKNFVKEPTRGDRLLQFAMTNWPLFVPIPAFFFMFFIWFTRGRDPRSGPVTVQYGPPDGLTPAEAGTLVDETAAMRDITATIVDLAVRGFLTIEEQDKSGLMGLMHSKEYVFHLKRDPHDWTNLKTHERVLLSGIFSYGAETDVELSSLQNKFYRSIPGIKNSIFDALMKRGYFLHRPDYVRGGYLSGGIVTGVLLCFLGSWMAQHMGMAAGTFVISGLVTAGIIIAFGWFMPARTAGGAKALAGVLGFEDFLSHVEGDQLNRLSQTPETFEKFLPYAMALGVEKKWVAKFQNIYTEPPSWYQGGFYNGGFYPLMFVNSLDSMSAQAGSVMASAPRSSGGSGFGGGGSSGGGGGGGGVGGF